MRARGSTSVPSIDTEPAVGRRKAGQAAEERRLSRAVWPDQPEDLIRPNGKARAAQGPESAEALREIVDADQDRGGRTPNKLAEVCVTFVVSWARGCAHPSHPTPELPK